MKLSSKLKWHSVLALVLCLGSKAWAVDSAPEATQNSGTVVTDAAPMKRVDQLRASRLRLEVKNEEAFKERLEYMRLQDEKTRLDRFLPAPTADQAQK